MNETTHLLLPEPQNVDSTDSAGNNDERNISSIPTKIKDWWGNSKHGATISQRSINDTKHHELLSGKIGTAAYLIRDAVLGDDFAVEDPTIGAYNPFSSANSNNLLRNEISVTCRKYCSRRSILWMIYFSVALLILLSFFEPPHWCRNYRLNMITSDGQQQALLLGSCETILRLSGIPASATTNNVMVASTDVEFYPNTATAVWMSVSQSHYIEVICVSIIAMVVLLRIGRDGCSLQIYLRRSAGATIQWNRICQVLCIFTLYAGVYLEHRTQDEKFTKLNPYVRLLLLYTVSGGIQRDIQVLFGMLPEIFNVLFLLFVLMLFYAWFGVVMFVDSPEGDQLFPTLIEGLWTLWICVTTANYPDAMMPGYNQNRFVALYFISFMILTYFFLMNVILATVCNEYDTSVTEHRIERAKTSSTNLKVAFSLLRQKEIESTDKEILLKGPFAIERETVLDLLSILSTDFPELRLTEDNSHILFAILDRDGTSRISEQEFMNFGNVLMLELCKTSDYASSIEVYFPTFFHSLCWQQFRQMIMSPYFEHTIDCILILNAIVVGIQSWPLLSDQKVVLDSKLVDGSIDTIWEVMETAFTVVYAVEASCKISVYGWRTYCDKIKNVFDLTITILAIVSSVVIYYPNDYSDSRLIRMILSARVLRLIRILTALQPFQQIGKISAVILPAAKNVIVVLFLTMYTFAVLGMELYGGMITRDPNNRLSSLLLNTEFASNEYWANNFNDMIGGMNVLFNLLVVNNWFVCEEGYEAVTQGKWVRLFFISFHVIGVILVNNLVIAFIINKFLQQMALLKQESTLGVEHIGPSVRIGADRAVFDASNVTGTVTNKHGDYIARFRQSSSDLDDDQRDRERLRTLFSQV